MSGWMCLLYMCSNKKEGKVEKNLFSLVEDVSTCHSILVVVVVMGQYLNT